VQWTAEAANLAGTLHLTGTLEELNAAEAEVHRGIHPERPYTLVFQPSRFDTTRAPGTQQTFGAYCHVPAGSDVDMTDAIERQIERFAPGFRDLVLARSTMTAKDVEEYNPNYVSGDINGGLQDLRQLFTRPTLNAWDPYRTSNDRLYLCSSATPPGGGVHGMCGYHAARSVLRKHGKG
jgi:phytoene dehydrogenase-like protein